MTSSTRSAVARCWAGFALLGAGLVHLAVVREHWSEGLVHGGFFLVVGAAQVLLALVVMSRDRIPVPRIICGSLVALIAVWAVARTTGVPGGSQPWTPEPVGTADLLAVVLEAVAVVAVAAATMAERRPTAVRPARLLAGVGAGALLVASLTTPALAETEAGEHARPHGSHGGSHGAGHDDRHNGGHGH